MSFCKTKHFSPLYDIDFLQAKLFHLRKQSSVNVSFFRHFVDSFPEVSIWLFILQLPRTFTSHSVKDFLIFVSPRKILIPHGRLTSSSKKSLRRLNERAYKVGDNECWESTSSYQKRYPAYCRYFGWSDFIHWWCTNLNLSWLRRNGVSLFDYQRCRQCCMRWACYRDYFDTPLNWLYRPWTGRWT